MNLFLKDTFADERIVSRVFIIGCPRSGTTLLQSLIATHPRIASFPESHFFWSLVPRQRWLRILDIGIASPKVRAQLKKYVNKIGAEEMQQFIPDKGLFMRRYCQVFVHILDTLSLRQGKTYWVEKTPGHLHFIKYIEKLVVDSKFIHIIRRGEDVVASLYAVTHQYPEVWGGPRSIDQCIDRWLNDIGISRSHIDKSQHTLVRYEHLVDNTREVLTEICEFLGVEFDERMLQDYKVTANQVVLKNEPWKASVEQQIGKITEHKFYELFDERQRQYIVDRLKVISLDRFAKMATKLETVT